MIDPMPQTHEPLSIDRIRLILMHLIDGAHLCAVITDGEDRVGRAIVSVAGATHDELDTVLDVVAASVGTTSQVHALTRDGAVVTRQGVRDE